MSAEAEPGHERGCGPEQELRPQFAISLSLAG
jgi:hypothetical protein